MATKALILISLLCTVTETGRLGSRDNMKDPQPEQYGQHGTEALGDRCMYSSAVGSGHDGRGAHVGA